jgi:hypothetical protein
MIDLALIGCFTAFVLAVINPFIDILAMFMSSEIITGTIAILFSSLAVWLDGVVNIKPFILHTIAGAFLGSAFLAIAERFAKYRPTVYNARGDQ